MKPAERFALIHQVIKGKIKAWQAVLSMGIPEDQHKRWVPDQSEKEEDQTDG